MTPRRLDAERSLGDFRLTIYDLTLEDWRSLKCAVVIEETQSRQQCERSFEMSKDDYLLATEGIAGRRVDFQERDPKRIATFLISLARFRFYRRRRADWRTKKPARVGICFEDILLVDWDRESEAFLER